MNWRCASCGLPARTNRQKCQRCGSAIWKPEAKKDLMELAGPMKRIAPRGLLLTNPRKEESTQDPGSIECGKCRMVIYRADKGFDAKALQEARKKHYSISPGCEEQT